MPDLIYRVSQVDVFRSWEDDPEAGTEWLIKALSSDKPTEDMERGTAFHTAMETLGECELDRIESEGYTFLFDGDFEIPRFPVREIRRNKDYGGIVISGKVDAINGHHILDHKASTYFDAERYFTKYQWRYYLDIFNADKFTWYVWEMLEADEPGLWVVRDLHVLEQYRYPNLDNDCRDLALRLKAFAEQHLPRNSKADASELARELVP